MPHSPKPIRFPAPLLGRAVLAAAVVAGCLAAALVDAQLANQPRWWKGNLHTHSLWSDGDDYPEMIADWYKSRGYHFLALSDHNILSQGQRWIDAEKSRGGLQALEKYGRRYGPEWVEERDDDGRRMVRLKPLSEFRHLLEEPGRFLMIQSEEISDSFEKKPIHLNATNIRDYIPPQGGKSVVEVMQNNVNAVLEQREKTGQPMFPHLNHPNFHWAVTAEELAQVKGERFFEVYNGHPSVYNAGNERQAGTERMWDIILTQRLTELGLEPMYGVAVDDTHNYHVFEPKRSNAGRGWVVVRAARLTPESIVHAMEAGDFYASTGVRLKDVRREKHRLTVEIEPEAGVTYTTQFIGTRRDFDRRTEPVTGPDGQHLPVTRRYSADVGAVLAEAAGPTASYALKGDELYVRAKVISSKPRENPCPEGGPQTAWVQPLVPDRR
jgi:hypothetical protein